MQNRIKKELADLTGNPLHGVTVTSDANNSLLWVAILQGPEGTAYDQGKFTMSIELPENYPFRCPEFQFTTKIFHPNINESGMICGYCNMICMKEQWQLTMTVRSVLEKILNFMGQVNANYQGSCHNKEAMELYMRDRDKFYEVVRAETAKYAK